MSNPLMRAVWIVLGLCSVALGLLGVIVPGLPTTGFMVFAAWCFSRSSPKLEAWLLSLPVVGQLVKDYRAGLGMPRKAKVIAISMIVIACGWSSIFAVDKLWVSIVIALAGLIGVYWILVRVPTRAHLVDVP